MRGTTRSIIGIILIIASVAIIIGFTGGTDEIVQKDKVNESVNEQVNKPPLEPGAEPVVDPGSEEKPVPEGAVEACEGLNEGDPCSLFYSGNEVCVNLQNQLICGPQRMAAP